MILVYTTAPKSHDYNWPEVPVAVLKNRDVVREVRISEAGASSDREEYLAEYQIGRYQSGMYLACREEEWIKLLADKVGGLLAEDATLALQGGG